MVQFCYLRRRFGTDIVSRRLSVGLQGLKMGWNLGNHRIQDIQQPFKCETDSDNELKVTKKVTLKKFVAGHTWPSREDQYEIMTGSMYVDGYTT